MARGRTWFRVERDWFSDGAILELARETGTEGIAGWFRLLGRACLCEGIFDRELSSELTDLNLGINQSSARKIADAMVDLGLVVINESGFAIRSWANYQPPMRYTSPSARITQPVISAPQGVTTNVRTNEQTNERTYGMTRVGTILKGGSNG